MIFCWGCGKEIHESAKSCPHCGAPKKSGSFNTDEIPEGVKGWAWGAFLWNWIWAIRNRVWWGLLALIPYVGIIVAFWLGFKGRELSWKTGIWRSVEEFQASQRRWSIWGLIIVVGISFVGIIAAVSIPAYQNYLERAKAAQAAAQLSDNEVGDVEILSATKLPSHAEAIAHLHGLSQPTNAYKAAGELTTLWFSQKLAVNGSEKYVVFTQTKSLD